MPTLSREIMMGQVHGCVVLTNHREAAMAQLGQFDTNRVHHLAESPNLLLENAMTFAQPDSFSPALHSTPYLLCRKWRIEMAHLEAG
jgi:hypothetical protein